MKEQKILITQEDNQYIAEWVQNQENTLVRVKLFTYAFGLNPLADEIETVVRVPYTMEHFQLLTTKQKNAICQAKLVECHVLPAGEVEIQEIMTDQPNADYVNLFRKNVDISPDCTAEELAKEYLHLSDYDKVLEILEKNKIKDSDVEINMRVSRIANNNYGGKKEKEVSSDIKALSSMNRSDLFYVEQVLRKVLENVYLKNEEKQFDSLIMNTLNQLTKKLETLCAEKEEIACHHYAQFDGQIVSDETNIEYITALKNRFNISYECIFDDVNLFEE